MTDLVNSPPPPHGIGDDAAVIEMGSASVAVAIDTLVEGTHFRLDWSTPTNIGYKSVMVNVSDLAACGVDTANILVSLTVPPNWNNIQCSELMFGVSQAAMAAGADVIGGDTVNGPVCSVTVTALGPVSRFVARSGASAGHFLAVSGALGGAAAGVQLLSAGERDNQLTAAHRIPEARHDLASDVREHASAAIDISDGLASEIRHLARSSGVGFRVSASSIPVAGVAETASERFGVDPLKLALFGGDDYQILATFPAEPSSAWTVIGEVTESGLILETSSGEIDLPEGGWTHKL